MLKNISANDGAMITFIPKSSIDHGACSRLEPQPKFFPAIKILDLLNRSDFMTLSTSVAGNSSAANVYFANDGLDIYFFTFNPSRKAVQISINPKVQCVIRPDGEDGIKELQIDAYASKVSDKKEIDKARKAILNVTKAFSEYMHDDFLITNDVIGYYKIKPTTIKYVDFFAEKQFEWIEIPENRICLLYTSDAADE